VRISFLLTDGVSNLWKFFDRSDATKPVYVVKQSQSVSAQEAMIRAVVLDRKRLSPSRHVSGHPHRRVSSGVFSHYLTAVRDSTDDMNKIPCKATVPPPSLKKHTSFPISPEQKASRVRTELFIVEPSFFSLFS
jgi:hypothetical protein